MIPRAEPRRSGVCDGEQGRKKKSLPVAAVRFETLLTMDSQRPQRASLCFANAATGAKRLMRCRPRWTEPTPRSEGQAMRIHEYVVRLVDGLWQVRFDGRLVTGQPTQMGALGVAQALAQAGALRASARRSWSAISTASQSSFRRLGPSASWHRKSPAGAGLRFRKADG